MNPEAPQPPNLGRGGLRGFCEKRWVSHTTGSLCRARAGPPADPGFTAHPCHQKTNQNTPPTEHHRVCLFLELRKCRAPRQLSSRGSKPGGAIGGGRGTGPTRPGTVHGGGQSQGRATSRGRQVKWDGSRDASGRHLLKASLGPAAPSPGQAGPASTCPVPSRVLIAPCDMVR